MRMRIDAGFTSDIPKNLTRQSNHSKTTREKNSTRSSKSSSYEKNRDAYHTAAKARNDVNAQMARKTNDKFSKTVSGSTEIYMNLRDGLKPKELQKAYEIANECREAGVKYAKDHNLRDSKGNLITWDNEADAYRHYTWNAKMTRELGKDKAEIIATNHEKAATRYRGGYDKKTKTYNYSDTSKMDLHNNKVGRDMASDPRNKNKSADELFDEALKSKKVRTSPSRRNRTSRGAGRRGRGGRVNFLR
ncbi:MAG: hypothetical protein KAX49_11630 [Halanaerobiales bacterium]|nr:hypothetical protein [Halanaerobiales bacterium]